MKQEVLNVSQSSVAQALATDYFCIYYVNTVNDRFIEYSSSPEYRELGLPTTGDDIISFSRTNFEQFIYPDDRERFMQTFTKDNILSSLDVHGTFTMTFRFMFREVPTYVHLKVTRMVEEEARHVVIGISSVDDQVRTREAFERAHHASLTYNRVAQALAGDYFSIYIVNPDTDRFLEYSATEEYDTLGVEKSGDDFFNVSRRNMSRLIYPEDRDRFLGTFTKEKVMAILERDGSFTMKYRLMVHGEPTYVSMKATLMNDADGRHLIIGTNNIDAQMKREEAYRQQMAEAHTNARNDFLANMSHDIRTPMNAIVGYTNIAKQHPEDPAAVTEALDKIGSASHFLLSLINDILDISKIESGKMQLNLAPCDLGDVFRRIEDITTLQAASKSLHITYDHSSVRHFHVLTDELRIEQILVNIVSNAIKYTPEGKSVDLLAEEEPAPGASANRYRFIIRDTGIGISEDYLPHIFESFTREENTKLNRVQGTGLGLAITARVVEMMGGKIRVKSKPGEGSEFTVEVDLPPCEEALPAEEPQSPGSVDLKGSRILLVEDNDINAEIASMALAQFGVETERAENGLAGLEKVQTKAPGYYDAVLMDIQMPAMNGYECARAIRALGDTPAVSETASDDSSGRSAAAKYYRSLPIIAMSANAFDEDVRDCLRAGMNAHVAKPFDPDRLARTLDRYIHKDLPFETAMQ